MRKALQDPIEDMLESMREAFENTPPELAADILERGVQLSGGGSLLEGLAKRIGDSLKLPVRASEEPQDDVAAGRGHDRRGRAAVCPVCADRLRHRNLKEKFHGRIQVAPQGQKKYRGAAILRPT